jgi:hypothetical protein
LTPEIGSDPTVAIIRPRTPVMRPFTNEPSVRLAITLRLRMPSAK